MGWNIKPATTGDAAALRCCMVSAYARYLDRMKGIRLPPMDLDYGNEIRDFPTWIATLGGEVVGGITMLFEDDHASIANVAVHPGLQGQGLGKGLMEFAENEAIDRGYGEIRLATHVALEENLALYRRLGWSEFDRDDMRVYMRKRID